MRKSYWYPEVNAMLRKGDKLRAYRKIEQNPAYVVRFLREYRLQIIDQLEAMIDLKLTQSPDYKRLYDLAKDVSYCRWFIEDRLPNIKVVTDDLIGIASNIHHYSEVS